MTEDATLDEFASDRSDGDGEPARDDDGEPDRDEIERVDDAVATYRSAPAGRACDGCGDGVTGLWRDGDALVCPDCKEWQQ